MKVPVDITVILDGHGSISKEVIHDQGYTYITFCGISLTFPPPLNWAGEFAMLAIGIRHKDHAVAFSEASKDRFQAALVARDPKMKQKQIEETTQVAARTLRSFAYTRNVVAPLEKPVQEISQH